MHAQAIATARYTPETDRPFQHAEPFPEFPGDLTPENTRKVLRSVALQRVVEIALDDPDVRYVRDVAQQTLEQSHDAGSLDITAHDVLSAAIDELVETAAVAIGRRWFGESNSIPLGV